MEAKLWKILRNVIFALLGTGLALMALIYFLSLGRHDKLTDLLKEVVEESTGAILEVDDVQLLYLSNFPYLTLELRGVSLNSPVFPQEGRKLLDLDLLAVELRPLSMLKEIPNVRSVVLSGGKMLLFRDRDGNMNLISGKAKKEKPLSTRPAHHHLLSIDLIRLNDFGFQYLDSMRGKNLSVTFTDTRVHLESQGESSRAEINGTWNFDGLTFKLDKGGYLENKEVLVDLGIDILPDKNRLVFLPSALDIEGNPFMVKGLLQLDNPAYLELELNTKNIFYPDLLPLLTPALQTSLDKFDLDGDLNGNFLLAGHLIPGVPAPVAFHAVTSGSTFKMGEFTIDSLNFFSSFDSHCDTLSGPAPIDCLEFFDVRGHLPGQLPFTADLLLKNLKDPYAVVDTEMDFPLAQLDALLPESMQLDRGNLSARIHHEGLLSNFDAENPKPDSVGLTGHIAISNGRLRNATGALRLSGINSQVQLDDKDLIVDQFRVRVNGDPFSLNGRIEHFLTAMLSPERKVNAHVRVNTPSLDMDHFLGTGEKDAPRVSRRAKRANWDGMASVVDNILARGEASLDVYAGELIYGRFTAAQVSFKSDLSEQCGDQPGRCLELKDLSARIYDIIPLHADMMIRRPHDPQLDLNANLSVLAPDLNKMLPKDHMRFVRGKANVELTYEGAMNDFLDTEGFALLADVDGKVSMDSVEFELQEGAYRLDSMYVNIGFNERDLYIRRLSGRVNTVPLEAGGNVSGLIPFVFLPERPLEASLSLHSPYLNFQALPFLPGREKTVDETAQPVEKTGLTEVLDSLIQYLNVGLRVSADSLRYRDFRAQRVAFLTRFLSDCSEYDLGTEGCLTVDSFSTTLMDAIPLEMDIKVFELEDPVFLVNASVDMPLQDLNNLFPSNQLAFNQGNFKLDFNYRGQPHNHFERDSMILAADLQGRARLENASFDYVSKGYFVDSANATLNFDRNDLRIDTFHLKLNNNAVNIAGRIDDIVPFFISPNRSLNASLAFYSPSFSIDEFSAPRKREGLEEDSSFRPNTVKTLLDSTLNRMTAEIAVEVDRVNYRKFVSDNVWGRVNMSSGEVELENLDMEVAGGTLALKGKISGLEQDEPDLDISTTLRNVNVQEVFRAFDNFGQTGITSENLNGLLTAQVDFKARANNNYDLLPQTFQGRAEIMLNEGALISLPMFRDMNSILFRGRDMEDIRFARLENTFLLDGRHILIDHFNIYSSAFIFGLEGLLCFHDQEHTNLMITVPLSNLFHKHLSMDDLRKERDDDSLGLSVYLRMRKRGDKLKLFPTLRPNAFLREMEELKEE